MTYISYELFYQNFKIYIKLFWTVCEVLWARNPPQPKQDKEILGRGIYGCALHFTYMFKGNLL